ncbi:hypothetical protein OIU85_005507 [Salix viminalis]|uniref:Glycoside hydrolase family 5 domain-containing protein n=1 Tax=Salix viminalis TaxID=40686 RepID=A0A9Q0PIY5_SALVM|nr:hypothetical protein OIU85_005507 [Salix viminalis]
MKRIVFFSFLSIFSFLVTFSDVIIPQKHVMALPLSTDSRWIVDENGQRVKLACVNWVSHLEVMVAEGLSKQPMDAIAKRIVSLGFNCVRLTWPVFLVTNDTLGSLTVRQSLESLALLESISGIQANNPSIIDLPLLNVYQAVVSSLGDNNVMVILDNHVSKPGWCCSNSDGNGFFGDQYFDPDQWITGLTRMASMFNGVPNVVGMSLRNELRGPKQNVNDWYSYMQKGAEAVHSANPDVIVILSGLNYDKDLSFLRNRPVDLTFSGKIVFEVHWYGFTDGQAWKNGNSNQVCGRVVDNMMRISGFLLDQGWPLFVSEFGVDQRGTNVNDNRYLGCFLGAAAELDFDWALWTLQISALQSPFRGPGVSKVHLHKVIFHPSTGLCVLRKSMLEPLRLGPCTESEAWNYSPQKILSVKGTYFCLQTDDLAKPAKLGIICTDSNSKWETISDSKMHLSSKAPNGAAVCLDIGFNNTIVTSNCKCLSKDNSCDPESQWFKLVNSTRSSTMTKTSSLFSSILNFPARDFLWKFSGSV